MNFELEKKWRDLVKEVSTNFETTLDLQSIIFIIGLQELNLGFQQLKKDQKIEVMHIAICTLLEPYGYYEFTGKDEDGWPHFNNLKPLPQLTESEQELLIKESILDYFENSKRPL
ncbi:MAG: hypothetical protein H6600_05300 [Flavobacteriales bacterium]|nr:hypothetical protein [Flavobacteriales bacterium]